MTIWNHNILVTEGPSQWKFMMLHYAEKPWGLQGELAQLQKSLTNIKSVLSMVLRYEEGLKVADINIHLMCISNIEWLDENCAQEQGKSLLSRRSCRGSQVYQNAHLGNQHPLPPTKPWPETHRRKERRDNQETLGETEKELERQRSNWTEVIRT